jgi:hypothetical protein
MDAPTTPIRSQPPAQSIKVGNLLTVDRTAALIALGALAVLVLMRLGFGGALGG